MSDNNKVYEVRVAYIFRGTYSIRAASVEQARRYALDHCGLVLGGNIHSSLPDDEVDWDFNVHPEKVLLDDETC